MAPDHDAVVAAVVAQSVALGERIDDHIEKTYLDPLKLAPAGEGLRTRLLQVYVALGRYDTAIETGSTHLLDHRGDQGATYNHLGIAYYHKGDMTQAALHFQLAAEARPQDQGIRANLDRALRALGRPVSSPSAAVQYAAADTTKAARMDAADTFYWVE